MAPMDQRSTWTDERLDDLADAMRSGFARVDADIRGMRTEMHEGFASLRVEIANLRNTMFAVGGGTIVALIGVIGAILARG